MVYTGGIKYKAWGPESTPLWFTDGFEESEDFGLLSVFLKLSLIMKTSPTNIHSTPK